jgi:hypothetical protein
MLHRAIFSQKEYHIVSDQKENQRALINIEYKAIEPIMYTGFTGLGCGGFTWLLNGPFWGGFVFGASTFCLYYVGRGNLNRHPPKAKEGKRERVRQVTVQGEKWTFDQVAAGQFVTRQSVAKDFLGFLGFGKRNAAQRNATMPATPKPHWMEKKIFHSHCNGYPVELDVGDVWRFLRWAYKYRTKGKGLSERSWVRYGHLRGAWYLELPNPQWYWAMINMLEAAQEIGKRQLIQEISSNQKCLAKEPKLIMDVLRWLEDQRNAERI